MCNAVELSPQVKWIGCANELNAAYSADGYARIVGVGMLALVFHVVGMPSYQNQRFGKIAHYTLGDGDFGDFVGLSATAACRSAIIIRITPSSRWSV